MARSSATLPMTVEEWFDLPDEVMGELVDGRLVEEEVTGYLHEIVVMWVGRILGTWLATRGGVVAASQAKFALGPGHGRKPDLTVYLATSEMPPGDTVVRNPPDLAVEVLSPRPRDQRRDRIDKMAAYAAFGVRCYWLLDPRARILECYDLGADRRYVRVVAAGEGKVAVPGWDELTIDLDDLWRETDKLRRR